MRARGIFALFLAVAAGAALAQQIYRWTDEKGRVHVTDTPPPPGAKEIRKEKPPSEPTQAATPYPLAQAMKDFPVTLYTSPVCKEPCAGARQALNRRGVPFKEVLVWDNDTQAELEKVSGSREVPVLLVGRTVQKGFEITTYDGILDSAGYPRAGLLPARSQAAPPLPQDYAGPGGAPAPQAEPVKPAEAPATGPYAPGAPPQRSQKK